MAKTRHVGADFVDALPGDGERRLMLAVLIDAIRTLSARQPSDSHPHLLRAWVRELRWLQSENDVYVFSFVNICNALGFDADYVRRNVLSLAVNQRPIRICRYAATVGDSWQRQRKPARAEKPFAKRNAVVPLSQPQTITVASTDDRVWAAGGM